MIITPKQNSDHYAYDISQKVVSKGECYDNDTIDQSITNILGTSYGERVFNLSFGSSLPTKVFEIFDARSGEELLNTIVRQINKYLGYQIVIDEANIKMELDANNNSMSLSIPYVVKNSARNSVYKKKFIL